MNRTISVLNVTIKRLRIENARLHDIIHTKDAMILEYQRNSFLSHRASANHEQSNGLTVNTASVPLQVPTSTQVQIQINNSSSDIDELSHSLNQLSVNNEVPAPVDLGTNGTTTDDTGSRTQQRESPQLQPEDSQSQPIYQQQRTTNENTCLPGTNQQDNRYYGSINESLPQFDGLSHKKWVAFERTYQYLKSRGMTSDELISKFKYSLEGEAYDLVEDLLFMRENSDIVMSQLKEQYGNYDQILIEISREILKIEPLTNRPKHDVWELALKLKTFVTHAKAYGKLSELNNLLLCEEVVDKLRSEHQDMWGNLLVSSPNASIEELSKLLLRIARLPSCKKRNEAETELASFDNCLKNRSKEPYCPLCKGTHKLEKCYGFMNSSLPQRYNFINANNICTSCLLSSDHSWQNCPFKKACQLTGCSNFHHRSLHRFVDK